MLMRIGAVSRKLNLSVRRIIQYEEEGLLFPSGKTEGGHRLFDEHDINNIKNIIHLIHDRGLTLAGIKILLKMSPCWKIFPCTEKEKCLAFNQSHVNCWELRRENSAECACVATCDRCPIYMVRDDEEKPILLKMPNPNRPE